MSLKSDGIEAIYFENSSAAQKTMTLTLDNLCFEIGVCHYKFVSNWNDLST